MRLAVLLVLVLLAALSCAIEVRVKVFSEKSNRGQPKELTIEATAIKDKPSEYEVKGEKLIEELDVMSRVKSGEIAIKSTNGKAKDHKKYTYDFCVPNKACQIWNNGEIYFATWKSMSDENIDTKELERDAKKELGSPKSFGKHIKPSRDFLDQLEKAAVVGSKCEGEGCKGTFKKLGNDKAVAVVVLGPSASGKSFITQQYLATILKKNNFPADLKFHTVDGGKIREISKTWQSFSQKCSKDQWSAGCKNLYDDSNLTNGFKNVKELITKTWTDEQENIMIVETLSGPGQVKNFYKKVYKPLTAKYHVIMMAVYASRSGCQFSGSTRAVKEGKSYPRSNGLSWHRGMTAVEEMFNNALDFEKKNKGIKRTTFAILRNNYNDKDMVRNDNPDLYDQCKKDIMHHIDCRLKENPLKLYSPDELNNHKFEWKYAGGNHHLAMSTDAVMTLQPLKDPQASDVEDEDTKSQVENSIPEESANKKGLEALVNNLF